MKELNVKKFEKKLLVFGEAIFKLHKLEHAKKQGCTKHTLAFLIQAFFNFIF